MNKTEMILNHLKEGKTITSLEAFQSPFYVTRLSSIIFNLRKRGYNIEMIEHRNKSRTYAEYYLREEENNVG